MGILNQTTHRFRKKLNLDVKGNKIIADSIDRVVSYGCSFTHGDEIIDHDLLNTTFDEVNKLKKSFDSQVDFYKHYKIEFPNDKMREASWAGQLAKLMGKPFVSYAQPGTSLGYHLYQIMNDFNHQKITANDLILVGLTGPDRVMYYDTNIGEIWASPLPQYIDDCGYKYTTARPLIRLFDENVIVANYFTAMMALKGLSTTLNIRLQPMTEANTLNDNFSYRNLVTSDILDFACGIWKDCESIVLLKDSYLQNYKETIKSCGYGHPPIEKHIQLAESIFSKCVTNTDLVNINE